MLKIGLTGGIGAGKSTICGLFRQLGVPTFDADYAAKEARETKEISEFLSENYGESILTNEVYDNKKLARILFNNKQKLDELTDMISIHVMRDYECFCENNKDKPYAIIESAILFERELNKMLDRVICVIADEETRIKRVMSRNNFTREEVLERINNQFSNEHIQELSDFIVINNDDIGNIFKETFNNCETLNKEIIRIDEQIKCLC